MTIEEFKKECDDKYGRDYWHTSQHGKRMITSILNRIGEHKSYFGAPLVKRPIKDIVDLYLLRDHNLKAQLLIADPHQLGDEVHEMSIESEIERRGRVLDHLLTIGPAAFKPGTRPHDLTTDELEAILCAYHAKIEQAEKSINPPVTEEQMRTAVKEHDYRQKLIRKIVDDPGYSEDLDEYFDLTTCELEKLAGVTSKVTYGEKIENAHRERLISDIMSQPTDVPYEQFSKMTTDELEQVELGLPKRRRRTFADVPLGHQPHSRLQPILHPYVKAGIAIGELLVEKNEAYGDSFRQSGDFLKMLYPNGISKEQMKDSLCLIRMIDKMFRIATNKDAFGECPYMDIAGYAILGHCHNQEKQLNGQQDNTKVDQAST